MTPMPPNEKDLTEILSMAQDGETKLKEMSDHATMMSEKWRVKTRTSETAPMENDSAQTQPA
jgi:hypothetical protein